MKIMRYFGFTVVATVISISGVGAAFAYDDLPKLPPPEGWVQPAKQSEGTVTRDVENQVAQRFTAATGGNPDGLLSKQQAKAAGWGLVSPFFGDRSRWDGLRPAR